MRRRLALVLVREVGGGAVRAGVDLLLGGVGVVGLEAELLEDGGGCGCLGEGCAGACGVEAGGAGGQPRDEGL